MLAKTFISSLSAEQRDAATYTENPVMVLAGAGSGKTRTLIGRFLHLVTPRDEGGLGADPGSVMMVTFTNKAAREMRERIEEPLKALREVSSGQFFSDPWIGTFHGLSLRILRIEAERADLGRNFSIYDESDARSLLSEVVEEVGLKQFDNDEFFRDLERAKARMLSPEFLARGQRRVEEKSSDAPRWRAILDHFQSEEFVDIYGRYQTALQEQNAVDFNDLLNRTTRLFQTDAEVCASWKSTFRHFMVDEVQDINRAQVSWLQAITGNGEISQPPGRAPENEYGDATEGHRGINSYRLRAFPKPTIAFVGDDDQSIYGFRGSEVAVMRGLGDRFEGLETKLLKTSYRCQPSILEAANGLVKVNSGRFGKDLCSFEGAERLAGVRMQPFYTPAAEIQNLINEAHGYLEAGGKPQEYAVLVRTRDIAKAVAKEFRAAGMPVVEGKSSDIRKTMEVKDAMSFVTCLINPDSELAFRRILNKPSRGMGLTSLRKVGQNARLKGLSFLDELRTVLAGKVDVPEDGVAYPKRFLEAAKSFAFVMGEAGRKATIAPEAGAAIIAVLNETGYLPDLYKSALKSSGMMEHEHAVRDLSPREFLAWLISRTPRPGENSSGNKNASPQDEFERLQHIDQEDLVDDAAHRSEVARRIGNLSLLIEEARKYPSLASFMQESVLEMGEGEAAAGIQIMTMHGSKGLEFDHVRLPFWVEGVMPHSRAVKEGEEEIEEERRLAYVSLTRARKTVGITWPSGTQNCGFIRGASTRRSSFIEEIQQGCQTSRTLRRKDQPGPLYMEPGTNRKFAIAPAEPAGQRVENTYPYGNGAARTEPERHEPMGMDGYDFDLVPDHGIVDFDGSTPAYAEEELGMDEVPQAPIESYAAEAFDHAEPPQEQDLFPEDMFASSHTQNHHDEQMEAPF